MAADAAVCLEAFLSVFDIAGRDGFAFAEAAELDRRLLKLRSSEQFPKSQHDEIRCFAVHLNSLRVTRYTGCVTASIKPAGLFSTTAERVGSRPQVFWIGDRTFGNHPNSAPISRNRCWDLRSRFRYGTAISRWLLAGDLLHLHHFRIVCAVVCNDRQHRNAVMSGPSRALRADNIRSPSCWRLMEILPYFRFASAAPTESRRAVADGDETGLTDVVIILLEFPKSMRQRS